MGKSTRRKLKKATVRLYDGDLEIIAAHFPDVGYNIPVREAIHRLALRLENRTNQRLEGADPKLDIDITGLEKSSHAVSSDGSYTDDRFDEWGRPITD